MAVLPEGVEEGYPIVDALIDVSEPWDGRRLLVDENVLGVGVSKDSVIQIGCHPREDSADPILRPALNKRIRASLVGEEEKRNETKEKRE